VPGPVIDTIPGIALVAKQDLEALRVRLQIGLHPTVVLHAIS
ncbi:MAG: hypothetical protein ACJAVJ_002356, partial [Planctomycetota bacterium]